MNILIITSRLFCMKEEYITAIRAEASEHTVICVKDKEVTQAMIEDAEIIFGWPGLEALSRARKLKWLQLPSAGADAIESNEVFYNKDVRVTNSSGVYGLPIAEHVFSMILSYNHNLSQYACYQADKEWKRIYEARDFYGSTIGIIGLGDIGSEIAKRAKALGARVLAVKRTKVKLPDYVDELYTMEDLDIVLRQSDYVVVCLPNTTKTKGVISKEKLGIMKKDSFLVNIGRGTLIDQEALIQALRERRIGGAGLDVTEPEPLPKDSPLWEFPNVIITPHASGFSPTNGQRHFKIFYDNLHCYFQNKPLKNLVDLGEGY